jgi:hypothetical protein
MGVPCPRRGPGPMRLAPTREACASLPGLRAAHAYPAITLFAMSIERGEVLYGSEMEPGHPPTGWVARKEWSEGTDGGEGSKETEALRFSGIALDSGKWLML